MVTTHEGLATRIRLSPLGWEEPRCTITLVAVVECVCVRCLPSPRVVACYRNEVSVAGPVTFDPDIIDALTWNRFPHASSSGPTLTLAISLQRERR